LLRYGIIGISCACSDDVQLISIGKNWNLSSNPFNTLATSAILILLWNPLLIMDVGFQLSYAAVISIGAFFPYMNWWMPRETKLGDFLWKTTSMSLSAQLGTLPLTTFYFHQFPTLFLLANLIVIPMSSVLLIGGLILACLQWIKPVATVIGFLLEKFEWLMNEFIVRMSNIPFFSDQIRYGNMDGCVAPSTDYCFHHSIFYSKGKSLFLSWTDFALLACVNRYDSRFF